MRCMVTTEPWNLLRLFLNPQTLIGDNFDGFEDPEIVRVDCRDGELLVEVVKNPDFRFRHPEPVRVTFESGETSRSDG